MRTLKTAFFQSHFISLMVMGCLLFNLPAIAKWNLLQKRDPNIRDYMSIAFTGEKIGWAVGSAAFEDFENPGFIGYTMDGGKSWNRSELRLEADLSDVHFFDENHGWAVGQNGIIANTDNGKDWELQVSKVSGISLSSVYFVNKDVGYVVGENETILSTKNGGRQWKVMKGGQVGAGIGDDDTSMFNSVQFLNEKQGLLLAYVSIQLKRNKKV